MNLEAFLSSLQSWVMNVGIKIVIAVIILIISFLVINKISRSIEKKSLDFQKKNGKKLTTLSIVRCRMWQKQV